jgi:hypothetical protein
MNKRYLLFLDEHQQGLLLRELEEAVDRAMRAQLKERVIALAGMITQLKNPREAQTKSKGFGEILKQQVFGSNGRK